MTDGAEPQPLAPGQVATRNLREARLSIERHYITGLNRHRGRMADAAGILGNQRPNLYRKVRRLGISTTRTRSR